MNAPIIDVVPNVFSNFFSFFEPLTQIDFVAILEVVGQYIGWIDLVVGAGFISLVFTVGFTVWLSVLNFRIAVWIFKLIK